MLKSVYWKWHPGRGLGRGFYWKHLNYRSQPGQPGLGMIQIHIWPTLPPVIFYNKWVSEWMKLTIILHVCLFLGTLIYICINYGLNLKHQLKNKRVDFNWSVSLCLVIIPYLFSDVFDQLPIKKGRINWTLHVTSETIVIKTYHQRRQRLNPSFMNTWNK